MIPGDYVTLNICLPFDTYQVFSIRSAIDDLSATDGIEQLLIEIATNFNSQRGKTC